MNSRPELGMYAWCPFVEAGCRPVMLYGQVDRLFSDQVRVHFFDFTRSCSYLKQYADSVIVPIDDLIRAPAMNGSRIRFEGHYAEILPCSSLTRCEDELYAYSVSITKNGYSTVEIVTEDQLQIHLTSGKRDPIEMLLSRCPGDAERFLKRRIISESQATIRNAPVGLKSLLGTRADLYPHQIDTIVRAFSERPFRLMLADEVGLGKTIEAGAILKGMKESDPTHRALIIVPDSLTEQWLSELWNRFFIQAQVWVPGTVGTSSKRVHLLKFSDVTKCADGILSKQACVNLLIVDEAHKLLTQEAVYRSVFTISKAAQNVLLLSATLVLRHSVENKKLLTLLDPEQYLSVTEQAFQDLVNRQALIREHVFSMVRDLPDYLEYNLKDEYLEKLSSIQKEVRDQKLGTLISQLQGQPDPEQCLSSLRTILAYLSEYYRLDRNVIRHRKNEIPQAQPPRALVELEYTPAGISEGFYEQECLDSAMDVFTFVFSQHRDPAIVRMCKMLFQATTSSPHAVLGIVRGRSSDMGEPLNHYFSLIDRWKAAYDQEIERIDQLFESPGWFHSKISVLIRWIEKNDPEKRKKYLVFSEYRQTAELYAKALKQYFGPDAAVLFCRGMNAPARSKNVHAFQNTAECRFLVCDSSGGEGRNFQIADYIIHCDLSWSPAVMEQRIGRLDRIGREQDQEVVSVVLHADHGAEHDLFLVYDQGLDIFRHSLCGMEIAFEEIQQRIDTAFIEDPIRGLRAALPVISEYAMRIEQEVEQERYFDMARQLDADTTEQLERLVHFFTQKTNDPVGAALTEWAERIGLPIKRKKIELDGTEYLAMDLDCVNSAALTANRYALPFTPTHPRMKCTFSRKAAVAHEWLYFLAPSNALYESLADHATGDLTSATAAIRLRGCGFQWEGFLLIWNIRYDYSQIIEKNLPPDSRSVLSRFLPVGQVSVFVSSDSMQEELRDEIVSTILARLQTSSFDQTNQDALVRDLSDWEWAHFVRICEREGLAAAKRQYSGIVTAAQAKAFLEAELAAASARRLRGDKASLNAWIQSKDDIDLFLSGMENPLFELDAAAYITTEER